jgi:low temperature requirement protein LtrA
MSSRSIVSPEDQRVTFVELFFDLVFVFSVTQIVGLLHDGVDWAHAGQAVLVFWLVWWAWTQFTWALNAADTTHPLIALGTLLSTAVAFFMAVAVPGAFRGSALAFAVPYVLVRVVGLTIYACVASSDADQRVAVRAFSLVSASGLVCALAGAAMGGAGQYWLWGLTILLDVVAAAIGGKFEGWNLHPAHFAERHGLFVIIALGETLIVAAGGLSGVAWTRDGVLVAVLAVALTCGLWWVYFVRSNSEIEHALERKDCAERSMMARDAYSLLHFPMLCGVIAYAAAVEEAIRHPSVPLAPSGRLALAAGLALFVIGLAVASSRATGRLPAHRVGIALATAAAIAAGSFPAWVSLAVGIGGISALVAWESR